MEIEKGYHCVYSIKYHIVWISKCRYKKFFGQVEKRTQEVLKQIASEYDWTIEEIDISPNHIHLYLAAEPTDRPDEIIKWLKSDSIKILSKEYPYLKNKKNAVWGRGYFITTVNDKTTSETIKRYIRNQKQLANQDRLF